MNHGDIESDWDEVVDVICVGFGPGPLAYAICCAAADMDVLLCEEPAGDTDAETVAYLAGMTVDLADRPPAFGLTAIRGELIPASHDRLNHLEPFVGEQLRNWSADCLASPFGLLLTEVCSAPFVPMRTSTDTHIEVAVIGNHPLNTDRRGVALTPWLREQAEQLGIFADVGGRLRGLIFEDGRVAGAALHTAAGTWRVGATAGVALAVGPTSDGDDLLVSADLSDAVALVALVSRRAGRFARVELLVSP